MIEVWQVFESDDTGYPTRYTVLAREETITAASEKRRVNGLRLAAYHSMPISLDLWEEVPEIENPDTMIWVLVNTLITEVIFTVIESDEEHDDTYEPPADS